MQVQRQGRIDAPTHTQKRRSRSIAPACIARRALSTNGTLPRKMRATRPRTSFVIGLSAVYGAERTTAASIGSGFCTRSGLYGQRTHEQACREQAPRIMTRTAHSHTRDVDLWAEGCSNKWNLRRREQGSLTPLHSPLLGSTNGTPRHACRKGVHSGHRR
jgi:hypothetical protein